MPQPPPSAHDAHALFSELVSDCPTVDLHPLYDPSACEASHQTPDHTEEADQDDDPDDEYQTDPDTLRMPTLPAKRRQPGANSSEQRRRDHHNTHTRRCRARLNWRFDALNCMLPTPEHTEVKHKVHILDHAIAALTSLRAENEHLHLLVALRSNAAVSKWANDFASTALTASEALLPVLDMLTFVGEWPYAELWVSRHAQRSMTIERFVVKSSAMLEPALAALGRHIQSTRGLPTEADFVGQTFVQGAAQWSTSCADVCADVTRVQLLGAARIRTCLAVPVPVDGEATHVVALYDVKEREQDDKLMEFATFVTATVGNCFGAAQRKRACEEAMQNMPRIAPKATKLKD